MSKIRTSVRTWSTVAAWCGLVLLNLAPLGVARWMAFEPVFGWRKGPLSFEKPAYPPPGSEVFALFLLVVMVDVALACWLVARRRRVGEGRGSVARTLLQVLLVLGFFGVMEGGLRSYVRSHLRTPFRPSAVTFWELQPDLRNFTNEKGGYVLNTESHGFRGVRETAPRAGPGVLRIMAVGDSAPFGHGVNDSETWESRLEELLRQQVPGGAFEVVNACCPGWTTTEAIRFLENKGFAFHPDILVVAFNNDSGFDYVEEKERLVDAPSVSRLREILFRSECYLLLRRLLESRVRWAASAPAPPGPDSGRPLVRRLSREDFEKNIRELIRLARAHSCALVLVNTPIKLSAYADFHSNDGQDELLRKLVDFSYRESLKQIAREEGVPLLDAHEKWQHVQGVELYMPNDFLHPNVAGHELLARQVADLLREAGLVPSAAGKETPSPPGPRPQTGDPAAPPASSPSSTPASPALAPSTQASPALTSSTPASPALAPSRPASPAPAAAPKANLRPSVTINVISSSGDTVTGIFSGGIYTFRVAPGADLPGPLEVGRTLEAWCRVTSAGGWIIEGGYRHHGLPIAFGTVARYSATRIALTTPFGAQDFAVTPDSDMPKELAVGRFVNVKYYHNRGVPTVLNCHTHAGCFVEEGILLEKGSGSFTVRSLRGTFTFPLAPNGLAGLAVGAAVSFRYRLEADDRVVPLSLEKQGRAFTFTGKMTSRDPQARTLNVLDVFGDRPGEMQFEYERESPVMGRVGAGDLVTVTYAMRAQGLPRMLSMEKRALKPVYFGTIVHVDDHAIRLVTRQHRTRELRITPETAIPEPLAPGDMVDVIYRDQGPGKPRATGIFKK